MIGKQKTYLFTSQRKPLYLVPNHISKHVLFMLGSDYSAFGCYKNKGAHGRQVLGGQHINLQEHTHLGTTFLNTEWGSCGIWKRQLWQQMPPTRAPQSVTIRLFSSSSVKWASLRAPSSSLNKAGSYCVLARTIILYPPQDCKKSWDFLYTKYDNTLTINSKS